jgi:hypothetical protein
MYEVAGKKCMIVDGIALDANKWSLLFVCPQPKNDTILTDVSREAGNIYFR